MGTLLKIVGIVLGVSLIMILGKVVLYPLFFAEKAIDTGYEVTDKVLEADNVIYNYEWFKNQYEDIQALEKKIRNTEVEIDTFNESLPTDRSEWTFEDKEESARLNSIKLGLMNQLEDAVAEYNARSKTATRSIFKDGVIPDTLEIGGNILGSK
jgi:hypothetical protein